MGDSLNVFKASAAYIDLAAVKLKEARHGNGKSKYQ